MALYYAPAFFSHLLGRCLQSRRPLLLFCQLAATVLTTFAVCWLPFLSSRDAALQVGDGEGRGCFVHHGCPPLLRRTCCRLLV